MNIGLCIFLAHLVLLTGPGRDVESIMAVTGISDSIPKSTRLEPMINEASGITDSKKNKNILWVIEDSGNPANLIALGHDGKTVKNLLIPKAVNRDWEEVQLVNGNIYIGDIGDNQSLFAEYSILIFPEPLISESSVGTFEILRFNYEDGPHDVEAFLVDPLSKDIYLFTKRDLPCVVYKISYPYCSGLCTAKKIMTLPYFGVTGAAISHSGEELLVRTYLNVYSYKCKRGTSIHEVLKGKPQQLKVSLEPQGEAICFKLDDSGFFTLSERGFSTTVSLNFYIRK